LLNILVRGQVEHAGSKAYHAVQNTTVKFYPNIDT
jgi:hypothetical protein